MENNNKMRKKGQLGDMIFVLVTLISIAMTLIVAYHVYGKIDEGFEESNIETNESAQVFDDMAVSFDVFDKAYAFILVGLILALLISAYFIPSHPVFIVINIIGLFVLTFLGAVFSNLYVEFVNQPAFNVSAMGMAYPITGFIVTKLPWIGAILVFLASVIMYSKSRV